MNRKPIVAANRKMNKGPSETEDFLKSFLPKIHGRDFPCEIVIAPPFVSLPKMSEILRDASAGSDGQPVRIGAQDCSCYDAGAHTGEVSVLMLRELLVQYAIIGHSERRTIQRESDELIHAKLRKAREAKLKPIFCIGETLAQRETGELEQVLATQVRAGLQGLDPKDVLEIVIAYEPVWAIGTGVTATSAQAQEAHALVRSLVGGIHGADTASRVRILYGGSVKPDNAAELMSCPDIDGALVGGASLESQSFFEIIRKGCGES
jgi:triosephosphate isomerase